MENNSLENKKKQIEALIGQKRLNEAFSLLAALAADSSDWHIRNRIEETEQSYKYMIRYATEGVQDPKRDEIYESIIATAYELCDMTVSSLIEKSSTKLYYSTLRVERIRPESLSALAERLNRTLTDISLYEELPEAEKEINRYISLLQEKENIESLIFKHTWVTYPVNNEEAGVIRSILCSDTTPDTLRELVMSAVTLNLTEHYCETTLLTLLDMYSGTKKLPFRIKSLCCALIVMHKYRSFIGHSRQLSLRFSALADMPQLSSDIITLFLQFIRSRGTEQIMKKVQNELVPEIMKLKPEIQQKLRGTDFSEDPGSIESNPDWQEVLDKSGIAAKMQELSRMQMEGSDVFLSSFAQLKNFPFFSSISNWFLPFTSSHSAICRIFKTQKNPLISLIEKAGVFCDSDKYSFALSMTSVPEQQRSLITSQFEDQNAQLAELAGNGLPDPENDIRNIANKYVQNLYRFFNLFSRKSEFYNPFGTPMNLIEVPFIRDIIDDTQKLLVVAEFYFKQRYYADALSLFKKIAEQETPDISTYQKIGFCHENIRQYEQAVCYYEKAEILKADDPWTLKHLASCFRATGKTDEALAVFLKLETLQPQNAAVANHIGNCLLEAGKPQEALKYYFKTDYLANKGSKTMRPIAWCSFLSGNYRQSLEYYEKIIASAPTADDFINYGHVLLVSGQVKQAVESYQKAASDPSYGLEKFIATFESDKPHLARAGFRTEDLPIISDKIRYDSKSSDTLSA